MYGDVSVSVKAQELIVTQHIDAVGGRIHIRDVGPGVGLVLCSVHQNDFIGENALKGARRSHFFCSSESCCRVHIRAL